MEDKKSKKSLLQIDFDEEEFQVRKRLPRKYPKRKNDVYVTRQSDFKYQLARSQCLLDGGFSEIYIHGLGAAINRSMNLALRLQASSNGTVNLDCNTSTVELIDDLIPEKDSASSDILSRNNSAIHIRVYRIKKEEADEGN